MRTAILVLIALALPAQDQSKAIDGDGLVELVGAYYDGPYDNDMRSNDRKDGSFRRQMMALKYKLEKLGRLAVFEVRGDDLELHRKALFDIKSDRGFPIVVYLQDHTSMSDYCRITCKRDQIDDLRALLGIEPIPKDQIR